MKPKHVALHVPDLERAERFYVAALGMEVVTRESLDASGTWRQLPHHAGWDEARAAGVELYMVGLRRDDLVLALFSGQPSQGTLYLIGVVADQAEIAEVRAGLPGDTIIEVDTPPTLMFLDPFGFRWQLSGPTFQGSGDRDGTWIEL